MRLYDLCVRTRTANKCLACVELYGFVCLKQGFNRRSLQITWSLPAAVIRRCRVRFLGTNEVRRPWRASVHKIEQLFSRGVKLFTIYPPTGLRSRGVWKHRKIPEDTRHLGWKKKKYREIEIDLKTGDINEKKRKNKESDNAQNGKCGRFWEVHTSSQS